MADPPWADADDATLVAAAQADRRAFAPLYLRYVDPVYRYCLRWLGAREAAEDVTAQVFARAMDALPRYRTDGPSFRSWLFAIAHNALVDAQRIRRPTGSLALAALMPDGRPGPEDQALAAEVQVVGSAAVRVLDAVHQFNKLLELGEGVALGAAVLTGDIVGAVSSII